MDRNPYIGRCIYTLQQVKKHDKNNPLSSVSNCWDVDRNLSNEEKDKMSEFLLPVVIVDIIAVVAIVVGCAIAHKNNREKQEKPPLIRPIKIPTEDGYLLVDTFVPTDSIVSIKQIHEKGKCSDVNRKFYMGLSARHSAGCDLNKKTYAQTLYLSSFCPDVLSKLVKAIKELEERGLT